MRDRSTDNRSLVRHVTARLRQRCGVAAGDRLLVAVSGGADSVALLLLLADAAPVLDLGLVVAHFDHGLRDDSAADATWVGELARAMALEFESERWLEPKSGEAAARKARYSFLERVARAHDCAAIVTGHHLDDQIETVILRLGRGSGPRGALGMSWRRRGGVPLVRPLLDVRRAALRDLCDARGIGWREDISNTSRNHPRNRLRHDAMPALEAALGPRWMEHWAATIEDWRSMWRHTEADGAALLQDALAQATQMPGASMCDLQTLRNAPEPALRAALLRWLDPAEPSRAHLDAAVQLVRRAQSGRAVDLANGFRLARSQTHLALFVSVTIATPPRGSLRVDPVDVAQARESVASLAHGESPTSEPPSSAAAHLAADVLQPPLELRSHRPGDRVRLLGAPGHRTVARLFQDRRIPAHARAAWPVVVDQMGIVWVPGVGVAERARILPGTLQAMRASYLRAPGPEDDRDRLPEAAPKP